MTKIILWDWDNTLVDTFGAILKAQNVMREAYNLAPWTESEAKIAMNTSGRNLIVHLVGSDNAVEARKIFLDAYAKSASEIKLKAGAKEIVEWSKNNGFINILASNKAGSILRNEVETLGLTQYFEKIVGAEDFENDKPSKEFTDAAIKGYIPDEIYSIGDGKADISMGHNYQNGKGILVWTDPNTPEFETVKPDMAVSSLVGLKNVLLSCEKQENKVV